MKMTLIYPKTTLFIAALISNAVIQFYYVKEPLIDMRGSVPLKLGVIIQIQFFAMIHYCLCDLLRSAGCGAGKVFGPCSPVASMKSIVFSSPPLWP